MKLLFVTGNAEKFAVAHTICKKFGYELEQVVVDIDEIQGEDPEVIARDKARKAYEQVGKPVIVTDDSWAIAALNGFPGPYMKSVIQWFTPQHFIDLMQHETDRSVLLHQYLVYQDEYESVVFQKDHSGRLALTPRGDDKISWHNVIEMAYDDGKTLAEVIKEGLLHDPKRSEKQGDAWHDLISWLKEKQQA